MVFRDNKCMDADTGLPSLKFGPAYLHFRSRKRDFDHFFGHLSSLIGTENNIDYIELGGDTRVVADQERAIISSIQDCFSRGNKKVTVIYCTKHLKGEHYNSGNS